MDDQELIERKNEAARDVFGYAADELLGEHLGEIGIQADSETRAFTDRFELAMAGEWGPARWRLGRRSRLSRSPYFRLGCQSSRVNAYRFPEFLVFCEYRRE